MEILENALDDIVNENEENFRLKLDILKDDPEHFTLASYDKSESLYDKVEQSILGLPFLVLYLQLYCLYLVLHLVVVLMKKLQP